MSSAQVQRKNNINNVPVVLYAAEGVYIGRFCFLRRRPYAERKRLRWILILFFARALCSPLFKDA